MKSTSTFVWLVVLSLAKVTQQSQCNLQGDLDVDTDWYGFAPKFVYTTSAQVQFSYNITYSLYDSMEQAITIVLYKEQHPSNFSVETDCELKLEQKKYDELANLKITLNTDNFWSGCEDIGDQKLRCIGGRDFVTVSNTTFLIAAARCGKPTIRMTHKIGFRGYSGECQGTLESEADESKIFTKNLMIVTIITVINSVLLLSAITFLICRKWRLRSTTLKLPKT